MPGPADIPARPDAPAPSEIIFVEYPAPPQEPTTEKIVVVALPPTEPAPREKEIEYRFIPEAERRPKLEGKQEVQPEQKVPETVRPEPEKPAQALPNLPPNLTPASKKDVPNLTDASKKAKPETPPILTQPSKKVPEGDGVFWPTKAVYDGRPGRERSFADVIDLLSDVYENKGEWANDVYVSAAMRRYYKREYPEFFAGRADKAASRRRAEKARKAAALRAENRPSRARVKKGVHARRPA